MKLSDIRAKYPQYEDIPDQQLADSLYQKHYSDMPKEEFYSKVGIQSSAPEVQKSEEGINYNLGRYGGPDDVLPKAVKGILGGVTNAGAGLVQRATENTGDAIPNLYRKALSAIRPDLKDELNTINANDVVKSAGNVAEQKAEPNSAAYNIGNFVGENAPYLALGPTKFAGGIKGALQAILSGAGSGAVTGYMQPTQGNTTEETNQKAAANTETGALLGGALGGVLKGVGEVAPAIGRGVKSVYDVATMTPEQKAIEYVKNVLGKENPNFQAAEGRMQNANDVGIPLTLPEALDSAKLMGTQKYLSKADTPGATIMRDFNRNRFEEEIPTQVQSYIEGISPNASPDIAGERGMSAANKAIKAAKDARNAEASPYYIEAFKNEVPEDAFTKLMQNPVISSALKSVKGKAVYQKELAGLPDNNLLTLQRVKEVLDDRSSSLRNAGQNNQARLYGESKDELLNVLDSISPDYAKARSIYSADSEGINKLSKDTIGKLSELNQGNFETAIPKIFNDTPDGISRSRNVIAEQNPEVWNDLLAANMQTNLDKIRDGGFKNFYNKVYGNSLIRQKYQAAMTPDQYEGFTKLMTGLDDAMKVKLEGSDTTFNTNAKEDLGRSVGSLASKAMSPVKSIKDWLDTQSVDKNAEALAKLFTSPDLTNLAEQLKNVKQGTPEYYQRISDFIAAKTPVLVSTGIAQK